MDLQRSLFHLPLLANRQHADIVASRCRLSLDLVARGEQRERRHPDRGVAASCLHGSTLPARFRAREGGVRRTARLLGSQPRACSVCANEAPVDVVQTTKGAPRAR